MPSAGRKNISLALSLLACVAGMVMLAYASVPLYRVFCQVTGYGGTTQEATAPSTRVVDRPISVRFNADVADGMPWRFHPVQREVKLKLGENALAFYQAENLSGSPIKGTATYNVTPDGAGKYFNKIECFCFTEQVLEARQKVDMPVTFFVDPAMADDPELQGVSTITLSYTFFKVKEAE